MVMAGSLLRLLKQREPEAWLCVAAPPATAPLLQFLPDVDQAETLDVRRGEAGVLPRWRLARRLSGFDAAIVLPRSWKAALLPWLAGVPRRTGFAGEPRWPLINDSRPFDRKARPRTVDRFLTLALPRGEAPALPPRLRFRVPEGLQRHALEKLGLRQPDRPLLALCPGAAFGPAKRWPSMHFAAVARAWAAEGGSVWVFGQESDREAGTVIAAAAPEATTNLCGRTGLAEAVGLLDLAQRVVSNDSGLMHVAAALGRPLVALYGSSTAEETPPLSDNAHVLGLELTCRPCHQRTCPLGHLDCLNRLSPDLVLQALKAA